MKTITKKNKDSKKKLPNNQPLKTNLTRVDEQAEILPKVEQCEKEIKRLVLCAVIFLWSRQYLEMKLKALIMALDKTLTKNIIDRDTYIIALKNLASNSVKSFYLPMVSLWRKTAKKGDLIGTPKQNIDAFNQAKTKSGTTAKIKEEKQLHKVASEKVKYHAKGSPNVSNYEKELKKRIEELSKAKANTNGISLWQKAELDLRHEEQLKMINSLVNNGTKYAWTSSHPDCSKRCQKWQGKLMDLTAEHSELSGFRMRKKVDGYTTYCFKEIINQVDKYGYHNNIIVGFNCRHKLIEYTPNGAKPNIYDDRDVDKERKINAQLREYERKIRLLKQEIELYNEIDIRKAKQLKFECKDLIEEYKAFARKNGYAWHDYRIK